MPTDKRIPDWTNQSVPGVDSPGVASPGVTSSDEKPLRYPEFIARLAHYKRAVYEAIYPTETALDYVFTLPDRDERS